MNEKNEKFLCGVNDKAWGVWGSVGRDVGVARKCGEVLGEVSGEVSVGEGEKRCEGYGEV